MSSSLLSSLPSSTFLLSISVLFLLHLMGYPPIHALCCYLQIDQIRHPSVLRDYGIVLCMEGQFESDNPFHNEGKYSLSPVQLPGFARFGTACLPRPAGQVPLPPAALVYLFYLVIKFVS